MKKLTKDVILPERLSPPEIPGIEVEEVAIVKSLAEGVEVLVVMDVFTMTFAPFLAQTQYK